MARTYRMARKKRSVVKPRSSLAKGGSSVKIPAAKTWQQRRAEKMTGMRTNGGVATSLNRRRIALPGGFNRGAGRF